MNVFLSHSSADKTLARLLANDLEAAGVDVWLDQWAIRVGDDFTARIAEGLDQADFVIVLLTKASVASDWVNREWRQKVLHEARLRRVSVIPVRGELCDIPDFLARRSHADISGGSYPLGFRHLLRILHHHSGDPSLVVPPLPSARVGATTDTLPIVTPIAVEVSGDLIPFFDPEQEPGARALGMLAPQMRASLEARFGFQFPGVRIRGNDTDMPAGTVSLMIDEIPELTVRVGADDLVVDAGPEEVAALGIARAPCQHPVWGTPLTLVKAANRDVVEQAGLVARDPAEFVFHTLEALLATMPGLFLDMDIARRLVEVVELSHPDLVARAVPQSVSWFELTDVLRRLVDEDVSIGDLVPILAALAQSASETRDTVVLTEHARHALAPQITTRAMRDGQVPVLALDSSVEDTIGRGIQRTGVGAFLNLPAPLVHDLVNATGDALSTLGERAIGAVLFVERTEVRVFVRRIVSLDFPGLRVLSRQDIAPGTAIRQLARIHPASFGTPTVNVESL